MGGGPRRQWAPVKFLPYRVLTFERTFWNITTTKKRSSTFLGKKSAPPDRENPGYAYEKRAPALRWYGAPEWLIRLWQLAYSLTFECLDFKFIFSDYSDLHLWGYIKWLTPFLLPQWPWMRSFIYQNKTVTVLLYNYSSEIWLVWVAEHSLLPVQRFGTCCQLCYIWLTITMGTLGICWT